MKRFQVSLEGRAPISLWLILGVAFLLRIWGIGFGLPHIYHQDEPVIVNHAMSIGARGWNPHFFVIPPLSIYLLFILYAAYFIFGKIVGIFLDTTSFALLYLSDPTSFYLIGRFFLGVVPGVLGVWWLYKITRRFGERVALLAAFFLAISFLPVAHSHYIYADIPLLFLSLGMLGSFWDLLEKPTWRNRLLFGVFTGAAAATKYTAVYFLPAYILTYAFFQKEESFTAKVRTYLGAAFASLVVYALIAPYTFLDWDSFYSQIHAQAGSENYLGLFYHFSYSLMNGLGPPILLLGGAGFLVMRRLYPAHAWTVLGLCLLYYTINIFFSQPFMRYMLPIIPLFCLLAAFGWTAAEESIVLKPFLRRTLFGLLVIGNLAPAIYFDALLSRRDTRDFSQRWIEKNIPAGTVIVRANPFYAPHLLQSPSQIEAKRVLPEAQDPAKQNRLSLLIQIAQKKTTYDLFTLSADPDKAGEGFLFQKPYIATQAAALESAAVRYVIIDYSSYDLAVIKFKEAMADRLELVAAFSPYWSKERRWMPDRYSCTAAPDSLVDLFSRRRLGPYLEIYKVR